MTSLLTIELIGATSKRHDTFHRPLLGLEQGDVKKFRVQVRRRSPAVVEMTLQQQMVECGHVVVLVCVQAFLSEIDIDPSLLQLLQDIVIYLGGSQLNFTGIRL